jgi:hypothetical protein
MPEIRLTPNGKKVLAKMLEGLLSDPEKGTTAEWLCEEIGFDYKSFLRTDPCDHSDLGPRVEETFFNFQRCTICMERIPCE